MSAETESRCLLRVQKSVGRAVNRYGLVAAGDRVAVGMSGGKNPIVLLETLTLRLRRLPITYDLYAVDINATNIMAPPEPDTR